MVVRILEGLFSTDKETYFLVGEKQEIVGVVG